MIFFSQKNRTRKKRIGAILSEAFDGKMPEQLENASEESGGDDEEDDNTTDDDGATVCTIPIIYEPWHVISNNVAS